MTEFGVQLHGTFPMPHYAGLAREVERYAFHELTVHDIVWWRPVWPILTLIAANTERVVVGPDVTHPYLRHPAETAASVAAIDELSGGRAVLGLGAGSFLEPIGVSSDRPIAAVRETADLVARFVARDRTPYEGTHFRAEPQAEFFWQPLRPRIPIFVGTHGPKMVESAAAWADQVRTAAIWAPDFFVDFKQRAQAAAAASGRTRPLTVGCDVWLSLSENRDEARALGRRILAPFLPAPQFRRLRDFFRADADEVERVGERVRAGDRDGAAALISDATLDTFVGAGDPGDVVHGLRRLVAAGASTITFSGRLGPDPVAALRLLGERVLPEFD